MRRTANVVKLAIASPAVVLARLGLIDEERGRRVADLAWPRITTGLARKSQTTADLAMVGLAIGPTAIAGVGFAFAYLAIVNAVGWSFANGAIALFSQRVGADDRAGLDLAFKQTLLILLAAAAVLTVVLVSFAEPMIAFLGAAPDSLSQGTIYLQVMALALLFNVVTYVGANVLIAANDAWTPMAIRVVGAVGNIGLNALFIFGLGLGVFGAALGTVIASAVTALLFAVALLTGWLPFRGSLPVTIRIGPPYVDRTLARQLLKVGSPVVGKRIVSRAAHFAMLAIVAYFGTVYVAAYIVAREIRKLANTPGWGIDIAARSLVGQQLGRDDEQEAGAYGRDILRFAVAIYVVLSVFILAFAEQIAPLFTSDPAAVEAAVPFIMVMAVSLLGLGVDSASSGIIGGAGDTSWPLYSRLVGIYVFMLPIAYLGVITPLGIVAIYLAVTAETIVPAAITYYRFSTNKWKLVSRQYRASPTD